MTTRDFETLMDYALQAYRNGYPVVIFSSAREPLHGHEFLETVADLSMPLQAFFVDGVAIELWNTSKYAEALEGARKRFMEGKEI
jgi:hypothetical protein